MSNVKLTHKIVIGNNEIIVDTADLRNLLKQLQDLILPDYQYKYGWDDPRKSIIHPDYNTNEVIK